MGFSSNSFICARTLGSDAMVERGLVATRLYCRPNATDHVESSINLLGVRAILMDPPSYFSDYNPQVTAGALADNSICYEHRILPGSKITC